jgi:hypothetical protein
VSGLTFGLNAFGFLSSVDWTASRRAGSLAALLAQMLQLQSLQ